MTEKIISEYIIEHRKALDNFEKNSSDSLNRAAETVANAIKKGGRIYLCGNGGSAADCSHIASELVGRFKKERKAMPAMTFTADPAVFTSLGNDFNYSSIFLRQVEAYVRKGDVLWAISTSGSSENVLKAILKAKQIGAEIISLTGKPNSIIESHSSCCICANTEITSTAQEIHVLAYHIICGIIEELI
ncbi:D-sedoheptulose-7-phosphate isomerase [Sedimentisphaera salicampi]|uniref:D-sedoheptulose-7-phosphate isomerase n=1 Tax=Sedimentisphaera salicampi TaxID=1941349 RepID=UPI000B9CBD62|nr:SIS domain-containing protein [Sedimentisphaera salicampi]OXU15595.1 Phosphoheptose isomerase 1 [Sedimentisphaera salicampi]